MTTRPRAQFADLMCELADTIVAKASEWEEKQPLDAADDEQDDGQDNEDEFADPGYLGDGKPRYPIDTAPNTRAAWKAIHVAGTRALYTDSQLSEIEDRIIDAWEKLIDEAGPPGAQEGPEDEPA